MSEYNRETGGPSTRQESQSGYGASGEPESWTGEGQGEAMSRPSVEEEHRGEAMTAKAQEQAQQYTEKAKEVASEYGHKAQEQLETGKDQAAIGIEKAAEVVRERLGHQGGKPAEAGMKVADSMESAAGYLREHSTTQIWGDFETYVREHPTQAVAGAVFAGFVLGRILR